MRKANIIIALILIAFSLAYYYLITLLPTRNLPHTLGINFVPLLLVIILFALSLILLIQNLISKKGDEETDKKTKGGPTSILKILVLLFIIILYVSLMIRFGYLITTPIFLFLILWISGCRHWKHLIPVSLIVPFVIYYVFYNFFHVPLP